MLQFICGVEFNAIFHWGTDGKALNLFIFSFYKSQGKQIVKEA